MAKLGGHNSGHILQKYDQEEIAATTQDVEISAA
jgi:hypothetical protein